MNYDQSTIENIISDYYISNIKVKDIIAKYKLSSSGKTSTQTIAIFLNDLGEIEYPSLKCPSCGSPIIGKPMTRSAFNSPNYCLCPPEIKKTLRCSNCEYHLAEEDLSEVSDTEREEMLKTLLHEKTTQNGFLYERDGFGYTYRKFELMFSELMFMGSVLDRPLFGTRWLRAVTESGLRLIARFQRDEIIIVDDLQDKRMWILNPDYKVIEDRLDFRTWNLDPCEIDMIIDFWISTGLSDILDYYNRQCIQNGFDYKRDDDTDVLFIDLIKRYGIEKTMYLIDTSVHQAQYRKKVEGITSTHCTNYILLKLSKYYDKALDWDIKLSHGYIHNIINSPMTEYFFNSFLEIGKDGYYFPINETILLKIHEGLVSNS